MATDGGRWKKGGWHIVSVLVSVAVFSLVFSYLFSRISFVEVIGTLQGISLKYGFFFLLFSLLASLCRTWRYHLTLAAGGHALSSTPLFLITLVRNQFADLLPARLGTVIYIYLVRRLGVPVPAATASFALCFVFDIFALALFLLVAAVTIHSGIVSPLMLIGGGMVLGVASALLLFGLPAILSLAAGAVQRLRSLPSSLRERINEMLSSLGGDIRLALRRRIFWKIFWLSMVLRLYKYLSLYALFLALVLPMGFSALSFPFPQVFLGICSAEFAASLPISGIAGFGAYEGAWSLVFQLLGYDEKIAALTSISHHLITQVYGYLLGTIALVLLLLPLMKKYKRSLHGDGENGRKGRFFLWLAVIFFIPTAGFMLVLPPRAFFQKAVVREEPLAASARTGEHAVSGETMALPPGRLVYQCGDGIHVLELRERRSRRITRAGTYPRWSPDGRKVAFLRGRAVMIMDADGDHQERLALAHSPGALCFHPDGNHVLFTDGNRVCQVDIESKAVRVILTGEKFLELDMAADGKLLVATVKAGMGYMVKLYHLDSGRQQTVARGCSASLSPRGRLITVNGRGHRYLSLYDSHTLQLTARVKAPPDETFDNQFWSNHDDWLVSTSERGGHDIFLHRVSSDRSVRVTTRGNCDRGDLFLW